MGLGCLMLLVVLGLSNCQFSQTQKSESKQIAAVLPLTGSAARIGIWEQRGLELAIEQLNQTGELKAGKLKITYEDSQGDPKTGVSALQKILAVSKPPVIFSALSSVSSAALPILDRHQVVSMLLAVSLPGITDRSQWAFRCHLGSDEEAEAMAAYLATTVLLIKQLRELGVRVPVLGNLTLSLPSFLKLGGQALEGAIFTVTPFDLK